METPDTLVVEYRSLYPANGGCWVEWDFYTSCVLATLAGSLFDPASARIGGGGRLQGNVRQTGVTPSS